MAYKEMFSYLLLLCAQVCSNRSVVAIIPYICVGVCSCMSLFLCLLLLLLLCSQVCSSVQSAPEGAQPSQQLPMGPATTGSSSRRRRPHHQYQLPLPRLPLHLTPISSLSYGLWELVPWGFAPCCCQPHEAWLWVHGITWRTGGRAAGDEALQWVELVTAVLKADSFRVGWRHTDDYLVQSAAGVVSGAGSAEAVCGEHSTGR
jgi:hypothetical protein